MECLDTFCERMIDTLPDGLVVVAESGEVLLVNQTLIRMLGFEHDAQDNMVGQSLFAFVAPGCVDECSSWIHDIIQMTPQNARIEMVLIGHDATHLPVDMSGACMEWHDTTTVVQVTIRDMTKRKQQEEEIERSRNDLAVACDAILAGWVRALDLRNREPEGHTKRVMDMSIRLARALNIHGEALEHIRRGALLHDIGKMGVPDSILHKPSALTKEEWMVMREHPVFAHQWFSHITFLRPAIDIPYAHHEKWDGTGYPCGLRGEQIPLAARIFAVVDVWDALCSERPYRAAWPEYKVREYVRSLGGSHFDPKIVDVFLTLT